MNIAVITGASSGIGEQFLRQIVLERGSFGSVPFEEIWVIARRSDRLLAMKDELDPIRIRVFELDLTADSALTDLESELKKRNPTVGLLVNCAGVGHNGRFETIPRGEVHKMISLNCSVLAEFTSICLPYMIPLGDLCTFATGPRILNIASSAGFLPQPGSAVYAASKSLVISFSRALHAELRVHNIASTTVCPGPVATEFAAVATGVPGAKANGFKSLFVVKPARLVTKSIRASKKGRSIYVYGLSQKTLHLLTKILPTRLFVFLVTKLSKDARLPKTAASLPASTAASASTSAAAPTSASTAASASTIVPVSLPASVQGTLSTQHFTEASAQVIPAVPDFVNQAESTRSDPQTTDSAHAVQILSMYRGKTG